MNAIFGRKIKQTQAFLTDGTRIPVSVVTVTDNAVVGLKTQEKHGYTAVEVGFGVRKKSGKLLQGMAKKAGLQTPPYQIREVRMASDATAPSVGNIIDVDTVLKAGDIVKVTGLSKGKGFAGVVKRHNFRGGPRTHGQSDRERAPGSIGQTTTPGRVYRGKRMAGRMGNEQVTVTNLEIVAVQTADGVKKVLVKGLIPGGVNTIVRIEKTGELPERKFIPLLTEEEIVTEKVEETVVVSEPVAEEPSVEEGKEEETKESETNREEKAGLTEGEK